MISKHADVKAKDRNGDTPLYFSCIAGCNEAARVLLSFGAHATLRDVRALARHKETPALSNLLSRVLATNSADSRAIKAALKSIPDLD